MFISHSLLSPPFFASGGLSFDHRFLPKIDARALKTSLTRENGNDLPKNWGYGDFRGWTRFVQSLCFSCMKERDKRGSARRVALKLRDIQFKIRDTQFKI